MAKAIHRADLDGYTECGRLVEGSGLRVQPADGSGDPATCGKCKQTLLAFCKTCGTKVLCVRRSMYDPWVNNNGKSGGYMYWLHCPTCDEKMIHPWPRLQGFHRQRLSHIERLRQARQARVDADRRRDEEREQRRNRDESERAEHGVLVRGCAVCGEEPPPRFPPSWHRSPFPFLQWVWCPDHAGLGQEMDRTLTATFCKDAAAIRASMLARVIPQ